MDHFPLKGQLGVPRARKPEEQAVLPSREKQEAVSVFPSPRVKKDGYLKPPQLVRHHANLQPRLLWGEGWQHGASRACSPPSLPWKPASARLPWESRASWEPSCPHPNPHLVLPAEWPGIRVNESYSWFKCCFQPRVGISALILPLPQ